MVKLLAYAAFVLFLIARVETLPAQPNEINSGDEVNSDTTATQTYIIGPGDILSISVWKEVGMQLEVLVKPDGGITFPLAGDINAGGMSTSELKSVLVEKLRRYIPDPVVTVSVIRTVSNKIYVVGKVNRPGEFIASHYMDVLQALSLAGGLSPYAESDEIKIMRRTGDTRQVFEFDYDEVISGERLDMNIILKAGDTIVVP
jgi:polysaccharide export outer membrane protein